MRAPTADLIRSNSLDSILRVLRVRCVCQEELLPVAARGRRVQRALADLSVQIRGTQKSVCSSKIGV
jgi:hypothetical protein